MNTDRNNDLIVVFETQDEAPEWPAPSSRYDRRVDPEDCFVKRFSLTHSLVTKKNSCGETYEERQLDYWHLFGTVPVRAQQAVDVVDTLIDRGLLPSDTHQHSEDTDSIGLTVDVALADHGQEVAAALAAELGRFSGMPVRIYRVARIWQ